MSRKVRSRFFKALEQIDPKKLRGSIVAVPVLNIPAFLAGVRGNPLETFSYDMNQLYPRKVAGYPHEDYAGAYFAERDLVGNYSCRDSGGRLDSVWILAELFRAGREVANGDMGRDAGGRASAYQQRVVDDDLPRHRHHGDWLRDVLDPNMRGRD